MKPPFHKLDNPVWHSLSETHKKYALGNDNMKLYHPDYCPFGGFQTLVSEDKVLADYASQLGSFLILSQKPILPENLLLGEEGFALQMLLHKRIDLVCKDEIIKLNNTHLDDLLELVRIAYPFYFRPKTSLLGHYYGIYKNGQLVAMAGERMQMNEFIEVSAVITHPDHTGNGYAKQLVVHTINAIFDQSKTPFLHVADHNLGAIALYKKLGFKTRKTTSFWDITKV